MRNIVIVEAGSTGYNYIRDIVDRNYNPIILDMKFEGTEENDAYKEMVYHSYDLIDDDYDLIFEKDTYEENLEMIREYDPLLVLPGTESGVRLATRLANDLGLLCNPIENLDAFTLKDKMQEKIAEAGLRHIRGRLVRSVEEAVDYYDEENLDEVVVKPILSAGSVGVRICMNKDEMIHSLNEVFGEANLYGDVIGEMVVQERIKGEDYFVNTVSHNGDHRVTLIWKYSKVKTEEGGNIYDSVDTVNELGIGEADIVEYAYDVADALGIKYGPVHGEYMVDENGPVLIEVNCRPAAGNMDAEFLDRISGQHETDSILDSYLNPDNFYFKRDRGYKLYAHGCLKLFIVPKDLIAESYPIAHISNKLKSFYKNTPEMIESSSHFVKTQDFETGGGTVYLVHEDGYVLQNDLNFLRSIEKRAFELVLSEGYKKDFIFNEDEVLEDLKDTLDLIKAYGSTLLVTDQKVGYPNIMEVSPDEINNIKGYFDALVINLNMSMIGLKDDEIAYHFLEIITHLKKGGLVVIPESTYQYASHGRLGAEAIIKALGLNIELPLHHLRGKLLASKS